MAFLKETSAVGTLKHKLKAATGAQSISHSATLTQNGAVLTVVAASLDFTEVFSSTLPGDASTDLDTVFEIKVGNAIKVIDPNTVAVKGKITAISGDGLTLTLELASTAALSPFLLGSAYNYEFRVDGSLLEICDGFGVAKLLIDRHGEITGPDGDSIGGGGGTAIYEDNTEIFAAGVAQTMKFKDGILVEAAGTDANISVVLGAAGDSDYTDGLFTDLTPVTAIGVAIDRFNGILKALAPGPAPALDDIDSNSTGVSSKLSFGPANTISGYTDSGTTAGFSAVDVNGTYDVISSGNNLRRGTLNGSTSVTGDLNEDIGADGVNYPANAFGNADKGLLLLEVNGAEIHSTDLTSHGSGSSLTNSSGFSTLSAVDSAEFEDGSALDLFKHRTGQYVVAAAAQIDGWNYMRVIHRISGSADIVTNYVEWINDSNNDALSLASSSLTGLSMTGSTKLSGVEYHTGGTATYAAAVDNAYKNVYSTSQITFTETSCSVPNISIPSLTGGQDETQQISISETATINDTKMLNESMVVKVNVPHPIKSNLSNAGSQSISGLLVYNLSNNSTDIKETFRRENYRQKVHAYDTQGNVTDASNDWDSTDLLTDGLMFYNDALRSPLQGISNGNFTTVTNGPASNANYSSQTGTKTFYRAFRKTPAGSVTNFNVQLSGSGTSVVSSGTGLSSSNIHIFFKMPGKTGWMDMTVAFSSGQTGDNAGGLVGSLDASVPSTNEFTFGTETVGQNDYIVIKVEADASWSGNMSEINITF